MNSTLPHPKVGPWLPLLFGLIGASVLGIGAGLGTVKLIDSQWHTADTALEAQSTSAVVSDAWPSVVVYLVDTPEQEDWVVAAEQSADADRASSNSVDPGYTYRILRMTAPDADASLTAIKDSFSSSPGALRVIDMRPK